MLHQNFSRLAKVKSALPQWALLITWILVPTTLVASPADLSAPMPASFEVLETDGAADAVANGPEVQLAEASHLDADSSLGTMPWNALEDLANPNGMVKTEQMSSGCGGLFGCLYSCCEAYEACVNQCGSIPTGWSCGRFNQCQGDPCVCN